jgi:hypothetical protein
VGAAVQNRRGAFWLGAFWLGAIFERFAANLIECAML